MVTTVSWAFLPRGCGQHATSSIGYDLSRCGSFRGAILASTITARRALSTATPFASSADARDIRHRAANPTARRITFRIWGSVVGGVRYAASGDPEALLRPDTHDGRFLA